MSWTSKAAFPGRRSVQTAWKGHPTETTSSAAGQSLGRILIAASAIIVCAAVVVRAEPAANELTEYERLSGWQLLFDGKTTAGWRNYQSQNVSAGWRVDGGILSAGEGAGDLITKQKFGSFELSIEYRISRGGNSGILFHVTEDGKKAWHSGPELQLLDNPHHRATEKSGWLYGLYKPEVPGWSLRARAAADVEAPVQVDATRPAGEWNHIYLRVCQVQCEVALNGVNYFYFTKGDESWNQRVAASKFAKFPQFGKASSGHIGLQYHGNEVAFRNIKLRELTPAGEVLKQPIHGKLRLKGELAFPQLKWQGWEPIDENGQNRPLRFCELTHANDQRLFAAAQSGLVYVFDNNPKATASSVFLDIRDRVAPWREHNEEGLLGLALHPKFSRNGHVYVYYSARDEARTSVVSRFSLSKRDAGKVDPASERVLMRFQQPFHNHNGGCIAFGPDGYLYIALGDGGDRNDPFENGQDLSTLMGSILRIDVNQEDESKAYGIPADNPFVAVPNARPEIYAHGVRNIWRMAFDSQTGKLWAADVGQDLWEEINLIQRGGNYGWNLREGQHLFGNASRPANVGMPIDPIWEYDHRIGKSITGGHVYRSGRLKELAGMYLYADYVSGRIWALRYDDGLNRVTKNLEISAGGIPVVAFGNDHHGEVYYITAAPDGRCIFRFERE